MRPIAVTIALFCLLLGATASAWADNPKTLAKAYWQALKAEGFSAAPRYIHPDALAEFKAMMLPVFQFEAQHGDGQALAQFFGSEATYEGLDDMTPAAFMQGIMDRVLGAAGPQQLNFDEINVLGVVKEGRQRHVLTRMSVSIADVSVSQFEVLSFVPYEKSWRLQLNGQMQGLAAAMTARLEAQQAALEAQSE